MAKPKSLIFKLNDEERKLIENNYGLIFSFAIKKNLELDEVYGELATGMCYAAHMFNPDRGKFSTFAYYCMNSELNKSYKLKNRNKRIPNEKIDHYDKMTMFERESLWEISDLNKDPIGNRTDRKALDITNYNDKIKRISDILTDKERVVLYYKINELTNEEIGEILNVTHQCVTSRIKSIREKVKLAKIL